jgi:hypothetical protein
MKGRKSKKKFHPSLNEQAAHHISSAPMADTGTAKTDNWQYIAEKPASPTVAVERRTGCKSIS